MTLPHYAEVWRSSIPGRCFRMVNDEHRVGQPVDCPEPVAVRGRFKAPDGRWHQVESCVGHAGPLDRELSAPRDLMPVLYMSQG